jgi:high-affinity Fe2+/Pb2+ permease
MWGFMCAKAQWCCSAFAQDQLLCTTLINLLTCSAAAAAAAAQSATSQALEKAAADESASVHTRSHAWSVFILAASAVLREGIESIIFLAGVCYV